MTASDADWLAYLDAKSITPRPDCKVWSGSTDRDGYGRVSYQNQAWAVHRLAWVLTKGPIPSELQIDHLCRVRACCNPEHMELVTFAENIRRKPTPPRSPALPPPRPKPTPSRRYVPPLVVGGECGAGHSLTGDNVRYGADSRIRCRECARLSERRRPPRVRNRKRTPKSAALAPASPPCGGQEAGAA